MLPLTIHIITKNNEDTIEHCINSLLPLKANLLIGDLGCTDQTTNKCKAFGANVVKLSLGDDFSQIRNNMIDMSNTEWNMYLEPWEMLLNGIDSIKQVIARTKNLYKMNIIQGDVVTKQIRLWNKKDGIKFKNPVFETLTAANAQKLEACIAVGQSNNFEMNLKLAESWRTRCPLMTDPIYYTACCHLIGKQWNNFLNLADLYLYQERTDVMSVYMTHYYSSMVNCYIKKNHQKAIEHLMPCIVKKPTMAEFWCLLADVYYSLKEYQKAKSFYENAMILGSQRLQDDDWPLEISKYIEYPQKMITACKEIKQSSRLYAMKTQIA